MEKSRNIQSLKNSTIQYNDWLINIEDLFHKFHEIKKCFSLKLDDCTENIRTYKENEQFYNCK